MKTKSLKLVLVLVLTLCLTLLVGCGSVSQSYADKVNEAAKTEEKMTYEEVVKDLGDPTVGLAGSGSILGKTGVCVWVKGCKTAEDLEEMLKNEETAPSITVTFLNGKATAAVYADEYKGEK